MQVTRQSRDNVITSTECLLTILWLSLGYTVMWRSLDFISWCVRGLMFTYNIKKFTIPTYHELQKYTYKLLMYTTLQHTNTCITTLYPLALFLHQTATSEKILHTTFHLQAKIKKHYYYTPNMSWHSMWTYKQWLVNTISTFQIWINNSHFCNIFLCFECKSLQVLYIAVDEVTGHIRRPPKFPHRK